MSDVQDESVQSVSSDESETGLNCTIGKGARIGIVIIIALALIGLLSGLFQISTGVEYYPSSRILVTSAHIDGLDGYKKVYTDENTDYAVFVKSSYSANQLSVGNKVQIGNFTGRVTETHDTYFCVSIKAPESLPGMVVYFNGVRVGYLSSMNAGTATCTYY